MYKVLKQLGNGEFTLIESYDALKQALQQMIGFDKTWPGEYVVHDTEGNELGRTKKSVI